MTGGSELDEQAWILVADDQLENLLILEEVLGSHYRVSAVTDGRQVLDYLADGGRVDMILLDVMMPIMDGFETCRRLKESPGTRDIPVIFLTSLDSPADEEYGLSLGAEDFIHKPFSPPVVLARARNHLKLAFATRALRERNEGLERLVTERTRDIMRQSEELVRRKGQVIASQGATIMAFCSLAEARDSETGNHIRRTQQYVKALAEHLSGHQRFMTELGGEAIPLLFKSAPLHDVGKVAIPDAILLKPGPLTTEEWVVMRRHCEYGRDAIVMAENELAMGSDSFLRYAKEIAYSHHERWDGTGYPLGLAGEAIPVAARLMAVADVYDALISERIYKPAFSHERAVSMITAGRGAQFDPDVVDAMVAIADVFREIAQRFGDNTTKSIKEFQ
jgi:putative two-component system response regulator